jgi:hypothetical protein
MYFYVDDAVKITAMKKSTYYYRPYGRPKGRRPPAHTLHQGEMVHNQFVVDEIFKLIDPEYHDTDIRYQLIY